MATSTADKTGKMMEVAIGTPKLITDRGDVARYYLKAEMSRLLQSRATTVIKALDRSIDELSEHDLWRMLEAMSFTHRINGMFFLISDVSLDWYEVKLPVQEITMTGMGSPLVDQILRSPDINWSPVQFAKYLKKYYANHPNDDPMELGFRPRKGDIAHRTVMVHEDKGLLKMSDATHRLMQQVMDGAKSVDAYCAVSNGKRRRHMSGDSTFVRLRKLLLNTRNPDDREAILRTTELLAKSSTDGRSAIETYWVDHVHPARRQRDGLELLERLPKSRQPK